MVKNISILGSTGSIGTQALDVSRKLNLNISAITAYSNIDILEQQVREFKPSLAVVFCEDKAKEFKTKIADTDTKVLSGIDGLIEAATISSADMILNSVVGMVGLTPTLAAINAHKDIALANKETLVAGGSLVMDALKKNNVNMYPVDSEHSAIFQCLQSMNQKKELTVKDALNHPNWSMGAKITIDSASMMNKGLEIIEASWLFDMPQDKIDVVVHRESIIHSMIEFVDNSVIAQLGLPDMRIPIQYAITYPNRYESPVKELDLTEISNLSFYKPDYDTFKCLRACKKAIEIGKTAPAIANGANEVANKMFRDGKIKFLEIGDLVYDALNNVEVQEIKRVEDVLNADKSARQYVLDSVK